VNQVAKCKFLSYFLKSLYHSICRRNGRKEVIDSGKTGKKQQEENRKAITLLSYCLEDLN
jgi:hypothetical protein